MHSLTGDKVARFEYPCLGGPLDGEYAANADFEKGFDGNTRTGFHPEWVRAPGKHGHLRDEYEQYNAGIRRARRNAQIRGGGPQETYPGMIWVHKSLIVNRPRRLRKLGD